MATIWFVTVKFRESATPAMKVKHRNLIQRIPDLPFASNWESRSPDLHMICIDDENGSFRKAANIIFKGQDTVYQRLDNYRAADIVHRFLRGYKKNRDRQDRKFRSDHILRLTQRNNIQEITWSGINEEQKENINRLIRRYR